jgi:hypothetical protein
VADVESFRRTRPQRSLRWEARNLRVRLSDALGADFAAHSAAGLRKGRQRASMWIYLEEWLPPLRL